MKLSLLRLVFAAVALSPALAQSPAEPIRVGVVGPFTGGSAPMGLSMRNGVRLAAAQLNAAGGVLGRRFELLERDDEAKPEVGVRLTDALVTTDRAVAILGYINTGVARAAARIPQTARIPTIVNVSTGFAPNDFFKDGTGKPVAENYLFQTSATDFIQSDLMVSELMDRFGFENLGILHDETPYGTNGRDLVVAEIKKRNREARYVGSFKVGETNMQPLLTEAREAGVQALVVYGIGPENAAIARARGTMGWRVLIIGSWTMSMSNFIDAAGSNSEGVMMPQTFVQDNPSTNRQKKFVADYLREFKPEGDRIPSAVSAAQGYDSVLLLAEAIKQAGSTGGPAVRAALESLKAPVPGVVTTYRQPFSATEHSAIRKAQVAIGGVKNGRVALVTPAAEKPVE